MVDVNVRPETGKSDKPSVLRGVSIGGNDISHSTAMSSASARPGSPVPIRSPGPTLPIETRVNCTLSKVLPTNVTCASRSTATLPGATINTVGTDPGVSREPSDPVNTSTAHRNPLS